MGATYLMTSSTNFLLTLCEPDIEIFSDPDRESEKIRGTPPSRNMCGQAKSYVWGADAGQADKFGKDVDIEEIYGVI